MIKFKISLQTYSSKHVAKLVWQTQMWNIRSFFSLGGYPQVMIIKEVLGIWWYLLGREIVGPNTRKWCHRWLDKQQLRAQISYQACLAT